MPSNLPISTSAPQAAMPAARKPAGSNAPEDAQNVPGFMEVLAKQLKGPQFGDAKPDADLIAAAIEKNASIVPVGDAPADDATTAIVPADAATAVAATLPGEMLAAMMLPQAVAQTAAIPAGNSDDSEALAPRVAPAAAGRTQVAVKATPETLPSAVAVDKGEHAAPKAGQPQFNIAMADPAARAEQVIAAREMQVATTPTQSAAPLAALQTAAATLAVATQQPVVQAAVNAPVGRERWGEEFSQRITWLATPRQDQTAELHLNPPQLGPLDVVLKVSGDHATALFTSPHAAVRDAVEQALPRLRDMLADNGITLGNTTVSDQAPRESGSETARRQASGTGTSPAEPAAETQVRVSPISRHNGIVDTFA